MGFVRYPVSMYSQIQRIKRERSEKYEQRQHELELASILSSRNSGSNEKKNVNIVIHNHYNNDIKNTELKQLKTVDVIQFIK